MSRRQSTGCDTALVKALVQAKKAWNGRGNVSTSKAIAALAEVRKARNAHSGLAATVSRLRKASPKHGLWANYVGGSITGPAGFAPVFPRTSEDREAFDAWFRARAKANARIARRVRKKLGQPFRKDFGRKRNRRRAAGKNEVRP